MNLVICLVYVHVDENDFLFNFFFILPSKNEKKKFQLLGTVCPQKWTNYFKMFV